MSCCILQLVQNLCHAVYNMHSTLTMGCGTRSIPGGEQIFGQCIESARRIFGPNRNEKGAWRRFHNEELHSLYRSPNIVKVIKSRKLRWTNHVVRMKEGRSVFKILTGKPTGNRPLGRPRRWREDNIRIDLQEIVIRIGIIGEPLWMRHWTSGSISHGLI